MSNTERKRYYRKKAELFLLLEKMKLWPSRTGRLHGIREINLHGDYIIITTHCGKTIKTNNSRNCRATRWLRNKWAYTPCKECQVPQWKLDKYSKTFFNASYGSTLEKRETMY